TRFSRDWSSDVCSSDLSSGRGRIYQCGVRTTIGPHHPRLAYPTAPAFYPVPVRPLRSLPPASSPPRLTATQLPLASDSGRHGSQRTSTFNISAMPGAPQGTGAPRRASRSRSSVGDSRVAKLARHAFRKHVEPLVDGHVVGVHALQAGRPLGGQVEEERLRGEVDLRAVRRGLVRREIAWIAFFQALLELAVVPDGLPYRVHQARCRGTEGRVF